MTAFAHLASAIASFPNRRIGVVGDLMIDRFVYGQVTRISPEAPVPVVAVRSRLTQPGGAANTAVNVRSLGGGLRLFGVLGVDAAAGEVLPLLQGRGVDVSGVLQLPDRPSTVKTRIVVQAQQLLRIDEEQSEDLPSDVQARMVSAIEAALPELDLLLLSDYAKGVVTPGFAAELTALCRRSSCPLVIDPKPANASFFAGATVIKPNLNEALRIVGREKVDPSQMHDLCQELRERSGVPGVVVTAGAQGVYVLEEQVLTHLPGAAHEVYDVAGAGDSVLAALALGLASGLSLTDSARLGNLAGSIAVGHLGVAAVTSSELLAAVAEGQGLAA